jgi:hypothetical protein
MPTIALYVNTNTAADHYIRRRIALPSVTLAVILCPSDHTNAVQSASIERINGELLDIIDL